MGYRVLVRTEDEDYGNERCNWWTNFLNTFTPGYITTNQMLQGHNGKDIPNSWELEFDTEEDFIVFKLKFS